MAAAAVLLAVLAVAPASAGTHRARTFTGTCHFSGQVTFSPPLKTAPQSIRQAVSAPGTCSGTLVDRHGRSHQLSDAPVTFSETSQAENSSCEGGTAAGRGALRFRHGRIRFAFSETRVGGNVVASAQGRRGGSAHGTAAPSQSEDPVAIAQACAGAGLQRVTIDADFATTPSISG